MRVKNAHGNTVEATDEPEAMTEAYRDGRTHQIDGYGWDWCPGLTDAQKQWLEGWINADPQMPQRSMDCR